MAQPIVIRLMLLGDAGTGKSTLAARYINTLSDYSAQTKGHFFRELELAKSAPKGNLVLWTINGVKITIQLWDPLNPDEWTSAVYRHHDGFIVVYDLSDPQTLINAKSWVENCRQFGEDYADLNLVGNKSDLDTHVLSAFRDNVSIVFQAHLFEVSAKTGDGVNGLFEGIINRIWHQRCLHNIPVKSSRRCDIL